MPTPPTLRKKLIDRHETGVAVLVLVWSVAFLARDWLVRHDALTEIRDEALSSLIYVVPAMLVGWALIAIGDRYVRVGLRGPRV